MTTARVREDDRRLRTSRSRVTPRCVELGQLPLFRDPQPKDMRDRLDACADRALAPWGDVMAALRISLNRKRGRWLQHHATRRRGRRPRSYQSPCGRSHHPAFRIDPAIRCLEWQRETIEGVAARLGTLVAFLEAGVTLPPADEILDMLRRADQGEFELGAAQRALMQRTFTELLQLGEPDDVQAEMQRLLDCVLHHLSLGPDAVATAIEAFIDELLAGEAPSSSHRSPPLVERSPGALLRSSPQQSHAPPVSSLNR
jgi:hypothetical protein